MQPSNREIVTRSPAKTVRIINLPDLLPHSVEAESSLEAAFVLRAALLPGTKDVVHQPFCLPVSPRGYTPDFLHTLHVGKPAVVEIKPESKLKKYYERFDKAAEFLSRSDMHFFVITESNLYREDVHSRALLLRRYAKARFPDPDCLRVRNILRDTPDGLPLGSLTRKTKVSKETILHLIARRVVTTGARLLVDDSCRVLLAEHASSRFSFESWFGVCPWGSDRISGNSTDRGA